MPTILAKIFDSFKKVVFGNFNSIGLYTSPVRLNLLFKL